MIVAALALPLGLAIALSVFDGRRRGTQILALAGLSATLLLLVAIARVIHTGTLLETVAGGWPIGIGIRLRVDALGIVFALVSVSVLLAALLRECSSGIGWRAVPAFVTFIAFGMIGLCFTADAFNFYVFFEVAMTGSIALAAYSGARREYRAALVFAVVNMLGSAMFLAAVAGLYHVTGTLDMRLMSEAPAASDRGAVLPLSAALLVAFSVKLGLFPFHAWVPAVYRDTSPMVAAVLSGAIVNIGSYGLLRFASTLPAALDSGGGLLLVLGSLSVIYGSILALSQPVVVEILAYSSIAQAGYILLAIGLGSPVGAAAAVVYAAVNSITKALLFLTGGLSGRGLGWAFLVGALSAAGVPPAAGFFGKASIMRAAALDASAMLLAVVFAGSLLSLGYMASAYRRRMLESPHWQSAGLGARVAVAALALLIAGAGLWPDPLLRAGEAAAAALVTR
ncbi:MAG: complex I subunit 5 family protein [Vicinamibacterales bacterium]